MVSFLRDRRAHVSIDTVVAAAGIVFIGLVILSLVNKAPPNVFGATSLEHAMHQVAGAE
ncbi:MAG: hypothetical protein AAF899_16735 [Pseudomonadota bacterium]